VHLKESWCQFGFNWLNIGPVTCFAEHGNKSSSSIQRREFLPSWGAVSFSTDLLLVIYSLTHSIDSDSLVGRWATEWTIGVLEFDSRRGLGIFLFTTASRQVLGPTQPPIQWELGALSLGVKRSGREADYSPPSSAEIKNACSYTSTPPVRLHGAVLSLNKRRGTTLPVQALYVVNNEVIDAYMNISHWK
jgi:hypothetical protein